MKNDNKITSGIFEMNHNRYLPAFFCMLEKFYKQVHEKDLKEMLHFKFEGKDDVYITALEAELYKFQAEKCQINLLAVKDIICGFSILSKPISGCVFIRAVYIEPEFRQKKYFNELVGATNESVKIAIVQVYNGRAPDCIDWNRGNHTVLLEEKGLKTILFKIRE